MLEDQEYLPVQEHNTDPNEVVKHTQKLRYRIVDEMTNNGKTIPEDPTQLLMVLRDMDQSALTTRKLNIEEKTANDGRKALETFERLQDLLGGRDPFVKDQQSPIRLAERKTDITDGVVLPHVTMLPGEDFQGEQILNISDYVSDD